jgi:phage recombination protein Bet
MSTALAAIPERQTFTREQIDLLKRTICAGATDDELKLFTATAERLQLDPFARQVFAVKRYDSKKRVEVMAIQVSIDGFRLVAERTGHYAGQLGPFWSADGKEWLEVWLDDDHPPAAAKVGVLRNDFKEPLWSVATWSQYRQEGQNGITPMWRKMGPLMLAKCAESLGLRRAFPNELSGVYTPEEMAQATPAEEAPAYRVPKSVASEKLADDEPATVAVARGKVITHEPPIGEGQKAEIAGLVEQMRMTPEQLLALLDKVYGIKSVDDMAASQAADFMKRARKKLDAARNAMGAVAEYAEPFRAEAAKMGWNENDITVWCQDLFKVDSMAEMTGDQKSTALALLLCKKLGKTQFDDALARAVAAGKVPPLS